MPWKNQWRCVACKGKLTHTQVMCSNGRCPLCGSKGAQAGTIVMTTEEAVFVEPLWRRIVGLLRIGKK